VLITGGALTLAAVGIGIGFYLKGAEADREADLLLEQSQRDGEPALTSTNSQCSPPAGIPTPAVCTALAEKRADQTRDYRLTLGAFATAALLAAGTTVAVVRLSGEKRAQVGRLSVTPGVGRGFARVDVATSF
jgi:hypothetical protein